MFERFCGTLYQIRLRVVPEEKFESLTEKVAKVVPVQKSV